MYFCFVTDDIVLLTMEVPENVEPTAITPTLEQASSHEKDISDSVMWYEIPREHMFDGGKFVNVLENNGATISNIFEVIAPPEAEYDAVCPFSNLFFFRAQS